MLSAGGILIPLLTILWIYIIYTHRRYARILWSECVLAAWITWRTCSCKSISILSFCYVEVDMVMNINETVFVLALTRISRQLTILISSWSLLKHCSVKENLTIDLVFSVSRCRWWKWENLVCWLPHTPSKTSVNCCFVICTHWSGCDIEICCQSCHPTKSMCVTSGVLPMDSVRIINVAEVCHATMMVSSRNVEKDSRVIIWPSEIHLSYYPSLRKPTEDQSGMGSSLRKPSKRNLHIWNWIAVRFNNQFITGEFCLSSSAYDWRYFRSCICQRVWFLLSATFTTFSILFKWWWLVSSIMSWSRIGSQ